MGKRTEKKGLTVITPKMIEVGSALLDEYSDVFDSAYLAERVYKAMADEAIFSPPRRASRQALGKSTAKS